MNLQTSQPLPGLALRLSWFFFILAALASYSSLGLGETLSLSLVFLFSLFLHRLRFSAGYGWRGVKLGSWALLLLMTIVFIEPRFSLLQAYQNIWGGLLFLSLAWVIVFFCFLSLRFSYLRFSLLVLAALVFLFGSIDFTAFQLRSPGFAASSFWLLQLSFFFFNCALLAKLASLRLIAYGRFFRLRNLLWQLSMPVWVGILVLCYWQILVVGFEVSPILLPAPSAIYQNFTSSYALLWSDFQQTFLKGILAGYLIGCSSGFMIGLLIDRSPFLKLGLLPVSKFLCSLPIVGIAPIMVMWFGFDWPSKAAVVVLMTFFPMLANTLTGLNQAGKLEIDLMHSYHPSYLTNLLKVRLHQASPFIFNALKLNSTLAIIGGIVAEFFGTPTHGVGFRISIEVGRLNLPAVWSSILVSAVTGSLVYGALSILDKKVNFWHASSRNPHNTAA